jgi:PIN domain nuclease of toxin-antitoxin system
MIYLDTHLIVWLYAGRTDLLSSRARRLIDRNDLLMSPMAFLELEYLYETGRIADRAKAIHQTLQTSLGLRLCDLSFCAIIDSAVRQTWTRDPFDRIIVGQADAAKKQLLTRDQDILDNFPRAVW